MSSSFSHFSVIGFQILIYFSFRIFIAMSPTTLNKITLNQFQRCQIGSNKVMENTRKFKDPNRASKTHLGGFYSVGEKPTKRLCLKRQ